MSTFSLTKGSETALGMLASQAGTETLLLTQPARELRAELSIEPFTSDSGDQLLAVLLMREQRHSMTLQRDDGANVQHLADWIEAVANGTLDTAEAIPQRADPSDLAAATAAFHAAAHELNAQTEPAPAQDERGVLLAEARMVIDACLQEVDLPSELAWMAERASKGRRIYVDERTVAIRPAQTEQQPEQSGLVTIHRWILERFLEVDEALDEEGRTIENLANYDMAVGRIRRAVSAPQREQSGLVEALKKHRIALTPEYEGQWHAELYASFEAPLFTAEGDTPEDAVEAVVRKAQADRPTA